MIVDSRFLEAEMNCEKFRRAFNTSLDHTLATGLETAFDVDKELGASRTFYNGLIAVGSPFSVGLDIGAQYAAEVYEKETGKKSRDEQGEETDEFIDFMTENGFWQIHYSDEHEIPLRNSYKLLNVHVRNNTLIPSGIDYSLMYTHSKIGLSPLVVIARQCSKDVNLFVVQQKIPHEIDIEQLMYHFAIISDYDNPETAVGIWQLFGYPEYYNIQFEKYNRATGKVNVDLSQFGFEEGRR